VSPSTDLVARILIKEFILSSPLKSDAGKISRAQATPSAPQPALEPLSISERQGRDTLSFKLLAFD